MERHLFVLHLWPEAIAPQQHEWRGRVEHLESGEVYFFRDAATLYQVLLAMVPELLEGDTLEEDGD